MGKIGRNQPCPCGSGKKYKHCCLAAQREGASVNTSMEQLKISLLAEIEKVQQAAAEKKQTLRELGVFIFFSSEEGDAWLLEMTEQDLVQVAAEGNALEAPVDENPETIEINWSHSFQIRDRQMYLTSYEDKKETILEDAPTQQVNAAIRRLRKHYSEAILDQVHVQPSA